MKNKKKVAIIVGLIVMVAACVGFIIFTNQDSLSSSGKNQSENTGSDIDTTDKNDNTVQGTDSKSDRKNEEKTTEENKKDETVKTISLPYTIPGTTLVLTKMDSYDGVFLEDGSDKDVTGITAIVLENKGSKGVEYADITINQGGNTLKFKATAVPAGKTVVVQEAEGKAFSKNAINKCTAQVAELERFEMSESFVKVKELEDGSLEVKNLTNETIPAVRIFYKFALEKDVIYVGGITYTAKVTELEANATRVITPSHYAAGSSEIMMIRVYDTAE